jgi:hypothetical protein
VNRNRSADGQDGTDAFGADLYATLSYVAGHGAVLPFAGPLIGFQTVSGDGDSSSYSEQTYTFGVQAGAHAFATPSFSVDPSLMLGYMTGSGEAGASAVDFSGLVVGIRVALSGWLGGKSEEPRADDEPPEYYPPAYVPGAVPPSYPANPQPDPAYPPQPQQPGYPQQQPAYPQQQPGYPQQQPGYPPQQPGDQAPPSSPPPTSSSPSPALPPSAPAP